ncbi:MAG: epimerase [Candidatus Kerfeldbacteria bacterium CG08_land_8_20_14_0_20_40_16]|uniref:Epimerase n=1 Tax=Candidatus Kerfeldbacteria bacterium CG08_land_8_20_14_0_20_40_16 TaxID=2014244 RepID=A0A2H0YXM7_9BACT|nr:MAG: epimerase [Candidatus Kerfeldbacteria bacterium CG08_land_8_20_14_0_20_40_16]
MTTILVTGGAGFIGSHLCKKLIEQDKVVICLDNFNNYYSPLRKIENIKPFLKKGNFFLQVVDVTNKTALEEVFKKHKLDKVVHLAARAGVRPSIEQPLLYQEANVQGTVNLLELSKKYGIKNFIFGSSSSVYGENKKIPFSENDNVDYPISPYAASKKACELFCFTYSHLTNLNIVCLRFFTVYGPQGRPDMAPYLFTEQIQRGKELIRYGDGTTRRDYTYIDDIIQGILAALEKNFKFEIINLGNSQTVELNYFINVIEGLTGKKAKIKEMPEQSGDVPITYADISKAKKLLGYNPKTKIEEGMEKFIRWYKENHSNI